MHSKAARHVFTRLQSWVILTDHLDNYPVLLDGEKNSKKFQIFKKMQMKLGATQTEPYLALCHKSPAPRNQRPLCQYVVLITYSGFRWESGRNLGTTLCSFLMTSWYKYRSDSIIVIRPAWRYNGDKRFLQNPFSSRNFCRYQIFLGLKRGVIQEIDKRFG